jgi:hypothetical protein
MEASVLCFLEPGYDSLILCHVVGCLEVEVYHVLEVLPCQSEEQDPHTGPQFSRGSIEEKSLVRPGEDQSSRFRLSIVQAAWVACRRCLVHNKIS